jgi:hypothetical protein
MVVQNELIISYDLYMRYMVYIERREVAYYDFFDINILLNMEESYRRANEGCRSVEQQIIQDSRNKCWRQRTSRIH